MTTGRVRAAALAALCAVAVAATGATVNDDTIRRGAQVYERCAACHSIEGNRTGPQHCGLFGRRAGSAPGYDSYSKSMRDSRIVWNERALDRFLQDPMKAVPGTTMGYAGVKDGSERADLIAWLRHATAPGRCTVQP